MAIRVESCAPQDSVFITTGSSVYELVVLGGRGDVSVRGGQHFTEVTRVLFLGSIADDGSWEQDTIRIGFRMTFVSGGQFVVTSPVQSLSHHSATAASPERAAAQ